MILEPPRQNRARYDDEGNIILPFQPAEEAQPKSVLLEGVWTTVEYDGDDPKAKSAEAPTPRTTRHATPSVNILEGIRARIFSITRNFVSEGATQYDWSAKTSKDAALQAASRARLHAASIWAFLTQPVWIVNRRKQSTKQYSRLTLFLLDTVRFGGTFAALFVALFVSLNYQSFWEITQSYLSPIHRIQSVSNARSQTEDTLKQKLLRSPALATAGGNNGDLLSFLPGVGPPENRIIIPRLGLNVPLVTPSYNSLLSENWEGLETDIQDALQMGVVHYPGTARPGQAGNFFVTGHSSYYPWAPGKYKTVFARLHDLEVGDEYWVYYGGDRYRYIVREKKEVKPSNVNVLDQPVGRRFATLMTCTPVGTTLRRLIVTAEEIDPITGTTLVVGEQHKRELPKINVEALPI